MEKNSHYSFISILPILIRVSSCSRVSPCASKYCAISLQCCVSLQRSILQQCCKTLQRLSVRFRNSVAFCYSVGRAQETSTRELLQNATERSMTHALLQNATTQIAIQVSIQAVVCKRSLTHKM